MIRLITAGACALFLVGCTADASKDDGGNVPANNTPAAATDAMAKFELGKDI
jgi:hypothetical protein